MKAADVKAQINERIIKALSEGKIRLKPWTENGPRNLFSGRAYTGLNRLILEPVLLSSILGNLSPVSRRRVTGPVRRTRHRNYLRRPDRKDRHEDR